jgi:hypothetical protein
MSLYPVNAAVKKGPPAKRRQMWGSNHFCPMHFANGPMFCGESLNTPLLPQQTYKRRAIQINSIEKRASHDAK